MYTDDEILEHLTDGEGRGFLGRSMYDAIIEKINKKEAMYDSLAVDYRLAQEEIERLNKERKIDIKYNKYLQKELAKSNSIIKEVREYIENCYEHLDYATNERIVIDNILKIVKGDKE